MLRSPLARFLAIGALTLVVLVIGTNLLAGQAANREALAELRTVNEVLAESVGAPNVRAGLLQEKRGSFDRLSRIVKNRVQAQFLKRVNIWSEDGVLLFSDQSVPLFQRFGLSPAQERIFENGGTGHVIPDDDQPETEYTKGTQGTVQIFTRIETAGGAPLLFEGYYSLEDLEDRRQEIYRPFMWIIVGALDRRAHV